MIIFKNLVYSYNNMNIIEFNEKKLRTNFEITDASTAFVNCLRRICSSKCPTVTFDDTYHNDTSLNSIKITKNTSSLHNEFVSHRLSLIPINMASDDSLKISTNYNYTTNSREWKFLDTNTVPTFTIDITNNNDQIHRRNTDTLLDVTTNDFIARLGDTELDISKYFKPDPYTNEFILINKLKCNLINDTEAEQLKIECKPTIGIGKTRNDPTGTVSYYFKCNETEVESNFSLKIKHLQEERINKNLTEYTEQDISKLRSSYDLLDKDRVYIKNESGKANHFVFSIESIGFMDSSQIIVDSIHSLMLTLKDIRSNFTLDIDDVHGIKVSDNISINRILDHNELYVIKIENENHTIGNILKYYIVENYVSSDIDDTDKPFKIAGYVMPHPTIENIEFKFVLKDTITPEYIIDFLQKTIGNSINKSIKEINLNKMFISIVFIKNINYVLGLFETFLKEFTEKSDIKNPLFVIQDTDKHLSKNSNYV